VSTILDEVMAWALVDHDVWGVTARMSVEFKRPVPMGRLIRAEGRVVRVRRRLVDAAGIVLDPADGSILARSEATFVAASEDRKNELKARYGYRLEPDGDGTRGSVDKAR
jgi:acyl-coenzyme A thioesterase PaaI-like protein